MSGVVKSPVLFRPTQSLGMIIHSVNFAPEDLAAKRSGRNFTITAKRG